MGNAEYGSNLLVNYKSAFGLIFDSRIMRERLHKDSLTRKCNTLGYFLPIYE